MTGISQIEHELQQDNPPRECVGAGGKGIGREVKGVVGLYVEEISGIQLQVGLPLFDAVFGGSIGEEIFQVGVALAARKIMLSGQLELQIGRRDIIDLRLLQQLIDPVG